MAKQRIVIVGAGIVGVCSAYYITEHPHFDPEKYEIVIVEAVRPACAASGKAGGLLSKSAFPQQIVPLSYKLHEQLAQQYNGAEAWGYRNLTTISVEGARGRNKPTLNPPLPKDLNWIKRDLISEWELLGGPDIYAQVHPYLFTTFLLRKVTERGLAKLVTGKVTKIHGKKENKATGISYVPESPSGQDSAPVRLDADIVLIASGPWISKLLPTCPVVGIKAHSITVEPSRPVSAYALFTDLRLSRYQYVSPEIYARKDEIFVSGEGTQDPLPETADLVLPSPGHCDELFTYASAVSKEIEDGRILRKQACYLPVVDSPSCSGPFVGKTDVENLLVATGHSCWGINNAPATGYLIAELILDGKPKSANLRGLEPREYFDARPALVD